MSLGQNCFYTFKEGECDRHVVGQSRPAVVVGENLDGTVDVVVFTRGRDEATIPSLVVLAAVVASTPGPGCVSSSPVRGSTEVDRKALADEQERAAEAARKLAQAEAEAAAAAAEAQAKLDAEQQAAETAKAQAEATAANEEARRLLAVEIAKALRTPQDPVPAASAPASPAAMTGAARDSTP